MKTRSGTKRSDFFRRNKDEIKLGLTVDQAKDRRKV